MEKEVKKMITRRETLKHIIETKGLCKIDCKECLFTKTNLCRKLKVIGAMAILRMFRKKKKPTLDIGTKIRFNSGDIATVVFLKKEYCLMFESHKEKLNYLIGKTWEVVE